MELLLCFVALVLSTFYLVWWSTRKPPNFPPGPPRYPIVGNLHQLSTEPHKAFMNMRKQYGDIFSIYFGNNPAVVINEPKMLREMFSDPVFNGRANFLKALRERTGGVPRGIIFTHEGTWTEQRRFAIKTLRDFGFGKKSMEALVWDEVRELIDTLKKHEGEPIVMRNNFSAAVLNALWTLITGNRYSHSDPVLHDLMRRLTSVVTASKSAAAILFFPALYNLRDIAPSLFGPDMKHRRETMEKIISFIRSHIKQHQDTFQPHAVPRDFIDVYLGEMEKASLGSSFDGEEGIKNLTYTMFDLFLAGAETTSTTLIWMFFLLALHPEKQELLHDEIVQVVGTSRLPSLNDRSKMPYTEATIMEVMRFSSMVPTGVFHCALQDATFRNFSIPKNTIIVPNLYACMKDPDIWGDPDNFRPERFLASTTNNDPNENVSGSANKSTEGSGLLRHHEAFMPFSTGKRVCLGETLARDELFLFSSALFQRFKVQPDPKGPDLRLDYYFATVLIPKPQKLVVYDRYDQTLK